MRSFPTLALAGLVALSAGACSENATGPDPVVDEVTALSSVQPAGGALSVVVGDTVKVKFDHAVAMGMEAYTALHEGSVAGPLVAGAWGLAQDRMTMTFVPTSLLKPSTTYVIHLGGGMMDANGHAVNLEEHGVGMGGQWATQTMMNGGAASQGMMGTGWQHPSNGSYGMLFTFTTEKGPDPVTALSGMQPTGGAIDVAVGANVVVTFDHAMADGMQEYAALLEGSLAGPDVAGVWTMSEDKMTLTFAPTSPLKPSTTYVIQLGGAMMDVNGHLVNLETNGMGMGGQWATQTMMSGMGAGMGGQTGTHMSAAWQHPSNGSYGMVFTFTTEKGPDPVTALSGMQPMGGAIDVAVGSNVVVTFDHPMADGMQAYAALLEGSLAGPDVAGVWTMSEDKMTLTFAPTSPLKPSTTYVIQLGGAMMDVNGHLVNLETYGMGMGGQWATQTMMSGMGAGMGGQTGTHMGAEWQHPSNGSYGMVFTFTTAA